CNHTCSKSIQVRLRFREIMRGSLSTLLKVGGTADDLIMADRIISNAIEILYLKNKRRFVYQKNQYYTNKIDYIRWTKAWVYYSFSYYQRYIFLNKN
ncbi:hypothetical protein LL266_19065, partial [Vibrio anguillarum]|nr:hypothetical protein [Vibrio anguillarum]